MLKGSFHPSGYMRHDTYARLPPVDVSTVTTSLHRSEPLRYLSSSLCSCAVRAISGRNRCVEFHIFPYTITLAVLTAWLILASVLSISTGLSLAKALGLPPATPNRDFRLDYLLRFAALVSTLSILVGTAAFLHGLILLLQMTHQSLARDDTEEFIEQMDSMGLYDVAEAVQNQTKKNRQVAGSSSTAVGLVAFLINMVALSVVWKSRRTAWDERRNRGEDIGVSVIGMPDNVPPPPTYATAIASSGAETPVYPMPEPPPRYTAS
ncbi:uncharacterized protein LOC129594072 [Paramacrobiotus metropolitanus]|uniref:uncharacterized protein LOC129594072 n=1 Tax=Paramacrobiotus metropolitanus TaxID=2943436 RepID=UPI0024462C1C|nr:uncharacterized protein LOC129594072 [Paramacrobiotus metropolitanus]